MSSIITSICSAGSALGAIGVGPFVSILFLLNQFQRQNMERKPVFYAQIYLSLLVLVLQQFKISLQSLLEDLSMVLPVAVFQSWSLDSVILL